MSAGIEHPMQSDEELFEQCRSMDPRAWELMVRRYQHPMFALALQFAGSREEARDLAQEIFIRVYRNMAHYDSGRPFRAWLYSIARNLCIDSYRRRRCGSRRLCVRADDLDALLSPAPPTDAAVQSRERTELLRHALGGLGDINREAVILKDLRELSLQEMSDLMGVPVGTVKSRISRARAELCKVVHRLRRGVAFSEDLP